MAKYQIEYNNGSIKVTRKNHKTEVYRIPFDKLNPNDAGFEVKNRFVVYILYARNYSGKDHLYVGKSTNGIFQRPKQHKDKFNAEICFILTQEAKGTFLNDGTIQYLENQVNNRVDECNTFNNRTDRTNAGTANSSDEEECDDYLKDAYEMLHVLGLDLYSHLEESKEASFKDSSPDIYDKEVSKESKCNGKIKKGMKQELFEALQGRGRKSLIAKKALVDWKIPHDDNISYAKYNTSKDYYWMEPKTEVLDTDWTIVLFNMSTMLMTVVVTHGLRSKTFPRRN